MNLFKTILVGLSLLLTVGLSAQTEAIPNGALGLGKFTRGAYAAGSSPIILTVDRLTDDLGNNGSTKGSLRWCLTQSYPRIILFEVSGYISLTTSLPIFNNYISIYGQTAPSPGITITGDWYPDFRAVQVIIQHVRFRPSYVGEQQRDAIAFLEGSNVFVDRCSFSYAEDELFDFGANFENNGTVQNCIFSWGLNGTNSKGMLINSNVADSISVIRSAFIHCADRTPFPNGTGWQTFETVNTLAYNVAWFGQSYSGGNSPEISLIGNEWKPGPNSNGVNEVIRLRTNLSLGTDVYLLSNYSDDRVGPSEWDGVVYYEDSRDSTDYKVSSPFAWAEDDYYEYTQLEDSLTTHAGARAWDRDSVDILALDNMVNSTGSYITSQSEAYYPILAENTTSLSIPANPHDTTGNDGYSNLEVWVASLDSTIIPPTPPSGDTTIIDSLLINLTSEGNQPAGWINLVNDTVISDTITIYRLEYSGLGTSVVTPITNWDDAVTANYQYSNGNPFTIVIKNLSSDYTYDVVGQSNRTDASPRYQNMSVHEDTIRVDVGTSSANNHVYTFSDVEVIGDSITIVANPETSTYAYINGLKIYVKEVTTSTLTVSLDSTSITCDGISNGTITTTVTNGTTPYSYLWDDGPTTQNRTGLAPGEYKVTITDADLNTVRDSTTVTDADILVVDNTVNNIVTCYGGSDGSATIDVTGGASPYIYDWPAGSDIQTRTDLEADTYIVSVTDVYGCTESTTVTMTSNPLIVLTASITDEDNGAGDGAIDLTVSGGVSTYTYLWDDGPTTQDRTSLSASTYNVTVTDSESCEQIGSYTVNNIVPPVTGGIIIIIEEGGIITINNTNDGGIIILDEEN